MKLIKKWEWGCSKTFSNELLCFLVHQHRAKWARRQLYAYWDSDQNWNRNSEL